MHQPLHSSTRYSDQTPDSDEGGNLFPISNVTDTTELHGFWDSAVGMIDNTITRPLSTSDAAYISDLADQIMQKTAPLTNNVTSYNLSEWALDARALAIAYVYQNITWGGAPSSDYIAQGWEICQQQIGLAGYRLYLLLTQIYPCVPSYNNCPVNPLLTTTTSASTSTTFTSTTSIIPTGTPSPPTPTPTPAPEETSGAGNIIRSTIFAEVQWVLLVFGILLLV